MVSEVKKCFKCGTEKPVDDFYRHPKMADGRLGKCKTCTRRDVREYSAKPEQVEKRKAYERSRLGLPHRVEAARKYALSESGKAAHSRASRKYKDSYPGKKAATTAVNNAIRDGRMVKMACELCGEAKAEAHHDDYSKPLDVRWLCKPHHTEWHLHNTPKG